MFKGQHDIRRTASGTITLFDNGLVGTPVHPEGAKEYQLDEKNLTANVILSYANNKIAYSSGYGSVKRLPDGNTLINYGRSEQSNVIFNVVTTKGEKILEVISKDSVRNYRTYSYLDVPWMLKRPSVTCVKRNNRWYLEAEEGHSSYLWSNGEKTRSIEIKTKGKLFVAVPFGD